MKEFMNTLIFSKTRNTKSPVRAHATDAGIDFFLPNEFTQHDIDKSFEVTGTPLRLDMKDGSISIPAHGSLLISTGIRMIVPKGHALIFFNKSGVASKKHLMVGACVTANTIIETNKGKFTASTLSSEFCKKNNIKILSYNFSKNKNEYQKCDGFRIVNRSKCLKITFEDGSTIEGDENHCIYINNKWIPFKDL